MESAKIYPLNRNPIEGSVAVNAPATPPKAKIARSSPPGDPYAALQYQDRRGVRWLDQEVYLLP